MQDAARSFFKIRAKKSAPFATCIEGFLLKFLATIPHIKYNFLDDQFVMKKKNSSKNPDIEEIEDEEVYGELDEGGAGKNKRYSQ